MTDKTLYNQNGLKISELVAYLQTQYLDKELDGEVWMANTDNAGLTNQAAEVSMLNTSDVCFDIRREEPKPNPCIDIYYNPNIPMNPDGSYGVQETTCSICGFVSFYSDSCCLREKQKVDNE